MGVFGADLRKGRRTTSRAATTLQANRWRFSWHIARNPTRHACPLSMQYVRHQANAFHHVRPVEQMPKGVEWVSRGEAKHLSEVLLHWRWRFVGNTWTIHQTFGHTISLEENVCRYLFITCFFGVHLFYIFGFWSYILLLFSTEINLDFDLIFYYYFLQGLIWILILYFTIIFYRD